MKQFETLQKELLTFIPATIFNKFTIVTDKNAEMFALALSEDNQIISSFLSYKEIKAFLLGMSKMQYLFNLKKKYY